MQFKCGRVHINIPLKKISISSILQSSLLEQELERDEIYKVTWEEKNDWLPYLKDDVLSTAFKLARYSKGVEEINGFGMKRSITLPSLANTCFNSLRDENDEPMYTYNDENMRYIVRQSIKGGRCGSFNQYYKSTNLDEIFKNISKKLDVNVSICEFLNKYFEYTSNPRKTLEDEYESQFEDNRDIKQNEKSKHFNDKLSKLPMHEKLLKLNLDNVVVDFDASSLYPSALWGENLLYPKIETGIAFKPHMNNV